jgi:hypothetical protein
MDSVLNLAYSLLDKVRFPLSYLLTSTTNPHPHQGLIPDFFLRPIVRFLSRQRLRQIDLGSFEANHAAKIKFIHHLRTQADIAVCTEKANQQHYQVRLSPPTIPHNLNEH